MYRSNRFECFNDDGYKPTSRPPAMKNVKLKPLNIQSIDQFPTLCNDPAIPRISSPLVRDSPTSAQTSFASICTVADKTEPEQCDPASLAGFTVLKPVSRHSSKRCNSPVDENMDEFDHIHNKMVGISNDIIARWAKHDQDHYDLYPNDPIYEYRETYLQTLPVADDNDSDMEHTMEEMDLEDDTVANKQRTTN